MLSPPRDRPSTSRSEATAGSTPDFLSFDPVPCVLGWPAAPAQQGRGQPVCWDVLRWCVPGTSRVMVRPNHRAINAGHPPLVTVLVGADAHLGQRLLPGAVP